MGTITLTRRDRAVLHVLADAPADSEQLAAAIEYSASASDLADRLEELGENGLLWERDDGTYALTESGTRILEMPVDGSADSRIDAPDHLREAITELDLRPERVEAVFDAVAFLQYWGEATESELIDGIYSENPVEYETDDEWWQLFMRDILADLPDIDPPTEETDSWQYTAAEITERTEDGRSLFAGPTASYGSVKHALEVLDLPPDQRTAVHAVFAALRQHKTVTESELKRTSYEEIDPDMSANAWWTQRIEPVLRELPGIERRDDQTWQYTGDETDHDGAIPEEEHDETPIADDTTTWETEANDLCPVCQQPYEGRTYIEASETRLSGWAIPICIKTTAAKTPSETDITLYYHDSSDPGR